MRAATAQQRLHPREEFGKGEGLDQVVVGAAFQPAHAVFDGVARGQHEDGRVLVLAHRGQDLEAVHAGQHDVQDDEVVVALQREMAAVHAVAGQVHDVALLRQALFR